VVHSFQVSRPEIMHGEKAANSQLVGNQFEVRRF
jgi:hypothetical protein